MQKRIYLISCFLAVFTAMQLSACNKGGNPQVETAKAEAKVNNDQQGKTKSRVTYDLALLELHGPVHTVKDSYTDVAEGYSWEGRFHTFSKDGKIVKLNGNDPFNTTQEIYDDPDQSVIKYTRDGEGRIIKMEMWESIESYTWKGMRLASCEWMAEGGSGTETFHYDANGFIDYADCVEKMGDAVSEHYRKTYQYTKFDKYGNWTERTVKGVTTHREITYYE